MTPTPEQLDTLHQLINIGAGRAAAVLNEMLLAPITLQVPFIKVLSPRDVEEITASLLGEQAAIVWTTFEGTFSGTIALAFPPESASDLVAVVTDEEPGSPDLDSIRAATLTEIANILMNNVMGSISNVLTERLKYSLPSYSVGRIHALIGGGEKEPHSTIVLARTRFTIKDLLIEGDILLLFEFDSFSAFLKTITVLEAEYQT